MKLGICLHAKNEAHYLAEWITFHLALGFDRIWIYDNGSADYIAKAIQPFNDHVELIPWPPVPAFPSSVQDCLARARAEGVSWLALFDADEFIVPADGDLEALRQIISGAERDLIDQISIPMKFFSSNEHVLIPYGRVVDNYTVGTASDNHKSIVRVMSNPGPKNTHRFKVERSRKVSRLRIHHYRNKSREDELIRRSKGFVDDWGWTHLNSDLVLDEKRALHERLRGSETQDGVINWLSNKFGTPGTQHELGIDPIKVVILERVRNVGQILADKLSSAFRDITVLQSGKDFSEDHTGSYSEYSYVIERLNRANVRVEHSAVLWILNGDILLDRVPLLYRKAIVSSYPFGIPDSLIREGGDSDAVVPEGKRSSAFLVSGGAWDVSKQARTYALPF